VESKPDTGIPPYDPEQYRDVATTAATWAAAHRSFPHSVRRRGLQSLWIVATQHTIVRSLELDVLFPQLLLGILMPVDASLALLGK
jgi:hypothetical protein